MTYILQTTMKLGSLALTSNLFLAPMAGITDYSFRRVAREHGCGLAFTEMVSAEGLLRKGKPFLKLGEDEHLVSVQLFASNPEVLAEAARMAEEMRADAIDINMGCPAKQVVRTGAGSALMRNPLTVKEILERVRKEIRCPLTIKIRSGWNEEQINAIEISKIAEDSGVDAITVHPRTKAQGFCGRADWGVIREVKKAVRIPVIGNGDVTTPLLAKRLQEETGCDGVMIGRGALGNPWIFAPEPIFPSLKERRRMIDHHFSLIQDHDGEKGAVRGIRKHLYWYTKGLPRCASFHSTLSDLKEKGTLFEAISAYFDSIQRREPCQLSAPEEDRSVTGWGEKAL